MPHSLQNNNAFFSLCHNCLVVTTQPFKTLYDKHLWIYKDITIRHLIASLWGSVPLCPQNTDNTNQVSSNWPKWAMKQNRNHFDNVSSLPSKKLRERQGLKGYKERECTSCLSACEPEKIRPCEITDAICWDKSHIKQTMQCIFNIFSSG